jgi:hypothetical protein
MSKRVNYSGGFLPQQQQQQQQQQQSQQMSNGGILGSGIFGHFGSLVNCKAEDNSMYCMFIKFLNVFLGIFIILFILYYVYMFFIYKSKK